MPAALIRALSSATIVVMPCSISDSSMPAADSADGELLPDAEMPGLASGLLESGELLSEPDDISDFEESDPELPDLSLTESFVPELPESLDPELPESPDPELPESPLPELPESLLPSDAITPVAKMKTAAMMNTVSNFLSTMSVTRV